MLGLRHFHGHAIDLFLGNIAQFQNDGIVHLGPDFMDSLCQHFALGHRHLAVDISDPTLAGIENMGGTEGLGQPAAVQDGVTALDGDGYSCGRASGSPPPAPAEQKKEGGSKGGGSPPWPAEHMQELHAFLSTTHAKINHRITFVAPNHETYATFQKAIFERFPEGE